MFNPLPSRREHPGIWHQLDTSNAEGLSNPLQVVERLLEPRRLLSFNKPVNDRRMFVWSASFEHEAVLVLVLVSVNDVPAGRKLASFMLKQLDVRGGDVQLVLHELGVVDARPHLADEPNKCVHVSGLDTFAKSWS